MTDRDLFGAAEDAAWLEGRVERVLWAKDDGSWAILKVDATRGPTTVVGALGHIADLVLEGDEKPFASFEGTFERHATHGHQFKATSVLLNAPRTDDGLRRYLASAGVRGIGATMATRIVDWFGSETTSILETTPERLGEVPGIGAKRAEALAEAWREAAGGRALSILLRGLGLSARRVVDIQRRYGDDAYLVVTTQPYRLAEEVRGIGFAIADQLARAQGMPDDHPDRQAAAVRHVVSRATDDGHCFLPAADIADGLRRLGVPCPDLGPVLDRLAGEGRLIDVGDETRAVAVPKLAGAELAVAEGLALRPEGDANVDTADVDRRIAAAEQRVGLELDPTQRAAVRAAATQPLTVITGGPGTGKTTLVRVLLAVVEGAGAQWSCASPTGRAAKRLEEATGHEASTIHRLLEVQGGTLAFGRNADNPLEIDGLVVDEASMVDIRLIAALLAALPTDRPCPLVLVGDADQLPSVGPGQVLRDVLDSEAVPMVRLQRVHRQAARSGIVVAASEVNAGRVPDSGEKAGHDDFFLVPRSEPDDVVRTVLEVVTQRLPAKGFDPITDVQVLVPTRRGRLGTEGLNEALHDALVPKDAATLTFGSRKVSVGDRVVCTRNRYDLEVFNGDLGVVEDLGKSTLTVRMDDRAVVWPRDEMDDLELAWAMTVHKSQGSEYPAVVLVLHRAHTVLLRRNLVYTALTRAQRFFCGVGEPDAWGRAARQQRGDQRHTRLAALLRRAVGAD